MLCAKGEYLRRARAVNYFCGKHTWDAPIFDPTQNGPRGEQIHWPQHLCGHPSFPPQEGNLIKIWFGGQEDFQHLRTARLARDPASPPSCVHLALLVERTAACPAWVTARPLVLGLARWLNRRGARAQRQVLPLNGDGGSTWLKSKEGL